jgi:hypothetical protein
MLNCRQTTTGWILCLGQSEQETTNDPTSRTPASVVLLSSTKYKTIMFRVIEYPFKVSLNASSKSS